MQKKCPICKSYGKTNNLRLCKINYTECVYICTNELCSYPGNCSWEYVTYNLFEDSEDQGNTSEEVERDILNYAEKRKQMKYNEEVKPSENEIRHLVISEGTPNIVGDQNQPIDINSFQFNDTTTQKSIESTGVPDLNTNQTLHENSRSELLKYDAEIDSNKEKIGITCNKNKQNKLKIDVKSVVIYNSEDAFKTNFNTLKYAGINTKNIKNYNTENDKPIVLSGSVITSPNDKINSKSVPLKFVKVDNVDASNFVPCATNKKITLKFFNQPEKCETAQKKINELVNRIDLDCSSGKQKCEEVKCTETNYSHKLLTSELESSKCEIVSKEIKKSMDKNVLDFSPVKQEPEEVKYANTNYSHTVFTKNQLEPLKCDILSREIKKPANKIDLEFLDFSLESKEVKYAGRNYSDTLFANKHEPLKCEIELNGIENPVSKTDLNFLNFTPVTHKEVKQESFVTKSLILSPVKQQDASKEWRSNINIGLIDSDQTEVIKPSEPKELIRNKDRLPKVPFKVIDEIDLNSDTESLSPIMKKETVIRKPDIQLKSTKKAAEILNHYLEMADDKRKDVPIKETSVTNTNIDLKKFVGIANACKYSGFIFKSKRNSRKKNRTQIINEDIAKYNIDCPPNNIKEANIIVEEIASSEQMTPLKTAENEKCADQELDDLLGEFLQNVDIADINQANHSTNCSDLTKWLDLL